MLNVALKSLILSLLFPVMCMASATPDNTQDSEQDAGQALVNLTMMLDLKGIEESIAQSSQSIDNLAVSLTLLSKNESLNDEQRQVLIDTIENIDELTEISKASLIALPGALEQSQNSIAKSTKSFVYDVRFNVLLLLGVVVVAIVLALIAAYWFILRPMQGTILLATRNVSQMASAIQKTATALETTTENQKVITERINNNDTAQTQSSDQTSLS
ncbi:hypothetical protein [Vibrio methylphosphonaticus]|uniref:hypothetical protein n=1 Tax=Vibrio methylphosphonaticus TaxID=2946866 RepID=UPI00202A21D3|nr:hypothetical protein [Vibrio methylphosphonaticus]MCL9774172.1 hypothetical protein [Vibrio methylphosphonaticus]